MKIVIEYESSWRNSFLEGSNNEPLPNKGRKFVASSSKLKNKNNYFRKQITRDTVLGVLNRLIGDQRKLYQIRNEFDGMPNYFADLENEIEFEDNCEVINKEIIYIRNKNGSVDQNSFTGMVCDHPVFQSDYSSQFWGVLWLELEELFSFILSKSPSAYEEKNVDPIKIRGQFRKLGKERPLEKVGQALEAANLLNEEFDDFDLARSTKIKVQSLYCSALYLQLKRLESQFDMSEAKSKTGKISGISKNGMTEKDFMDNYTTGIKKPIFGNPYICLEFIKGEGQVRHDLEKASGKLTIKLNLDIDKAVQLKKIIENAGVSAFYLGKKGIAYVTDIDIR